MKIIRDYFYDLLHNFSNKLSKADVYEILEVILNKSYAEIVLQMDEKVDENKAIKLNWAIEMLTHDYPVAYITERQYFYGNYFHVNENVLIPRIETEELVEIANNFLIKNYNDENCVVYDVCTGSGAIGLSLKKMHPKIQLFCSDISNDVLDVAKQNAVLLNLKDVIFLNGNFLQPFLQNKKNPKANLVTINPPYIAFDDHDVETSVAKYEPPLALYASDKGLWFYEQLAKDWDKIADMSKPFLIICEFGWNQKSDLETIFTKSILKNAKISFIKDNSQNWRFFLIYN